MHRTAARIAADSRPVLVFTVALTVAVALASFALSFASLRDAALWGRVPASLAFLVPVVIDASVLVYGLVALVLRARGRSSAWAWLLMFGFTVVSIGANAAHAYGVAPELRAVVGVVLVALAPLSVLTSTHALASLVVADIGPSHDVEPSPARARTQTARDSVESDAAQLGQGEPVSGAQTGAHALATAASSTASTTTNARKPRQRPAPARRSYVKVADDPAVVADILASRARGESRASVAGRLGCSPSSVRNVERRQREADLTTVERQHEPLLGLDLGTVGDVAKVLA